MRTIDPFSARIFQIAFDAAEAVQASIEAKEIERSNIDRAHLLSFLFTKAFKTLQAVSVLWGHGFPEDTNSLVRTLFELMLQAAYVRRAPKKSIRLWNGYWPYFLFRQYKIAKKLRLGSAKNYLKLFRETLQEKGILEKGVTIKDLQQEGRRLGKIYKNSEDWFGMGIGQLAKRVGRAARYGTAFNLLSKFSHSNQLTMHHYLELAPKHIKTRTGPEVSDDYLPVLEAVRDFLEICEIVDAQLALGHSRLISRYLIEIERREKDYATTVGAAKEAHMT